MDFMFEDEVDEVGSDVEAYCPKCKADTTHVVISKYEDEIRRVQCNPCGDVHSYRKPRGEVEDDIPEPIAARKRAALKKLTWEEFFAKHGEKHARAYEFREPYKENVILNHPKFGKGFVSEVVSDSKVEITFKDARRVLVHNRKDIPGLPLAAEGDGTPTPPPAKAGKPKGDKADKADKGEKAKADAERGDKGDKGDKDRSDKSDKKAKSSGAEPAIVPKAAASKVPGARTAPVDKTSSAKSSMKPAAASKNGKAPGKAEAKAEVKAEVKAAAKPIKKPAPPPPKGRKK